MSKSDKELQDHLVALGHQPHAAARLVRDFHQFDKEATELRRYAKEIMSSNQPVFALAKAITDELLNTPKAERSIHILGLAVMLSIVGEKP